MNERIKELIRQAGGIGYDDNNVMPAILVGNEQVKQFAELIIEETLDQVDERTYDRGNTQWYEDDKKWVRLHFGYGEMHQMIKVLTK
jgi:hypothetical protein